MDRATARTSKSVGAVPAARSLGRRVLKAGGHIIGGASRDFGPSTEQSGDFWLVRPCENQLHGDTRQQKPRGIQQDAATACINHVAPFRLPRPDPDPDLPAVHFATWAAALFGSFHHISRGAFITSPAVLDMVKSGDKSRLYFIKQILRRPRNFTGFQGNSFVVRRR